MSYELTEARLAKERGDEKQAHKLEQGYQQYKNTVDDFLAYSRSLDVDASIRKAHTLENNDPNLDLSDLNDPFINGSSN